MGEPIRVFRVLVQGKHLFLKVDTEVRAVGFFTTRIVRAIDAPTAGEEALRIVRKELTRTVPDEHQAGAEVLLASAEEMDVKERAEEIHGFSWYLEDASGAPGGSVSWN
jgi:hypothetical protein